MRFSEVILKGANNGEEEYDDDDDDDDDDVDTLFNGLANKTGKEPLQKLEEDFDTFRTTKVNDVAQPLVDAQIPSTL